MVAPESAIRFPPVILSVPPHIETVVLATLRPAGSASVKATPVSATALAGGLATVNVREVLAPTPMDAAPNAFAIEGGATTRTAAVAAAPDPASWWRRLRLRRRSA